MKSVFDQNAHGARRRFMKGALGVAALGLVPGFAARASTPVWKPTSAVTLLSGFSPGGAGDTICRILADGVNRLYGVNVVVETKAGASGFLAAQAASRAAPDGHTICFATMTMLTSAYQLPGVSLPINVPVDLTPIASLASIPTMLAVSPHTKFRTIAELVEQAKANPGSITYGSAGVGSAPHMAVALFAKEMGIELNHIPYKGGAQAILDLRAGRIDMLLGNMPDFLALIQSGDLIGIGFAGGEPLAEFPNIPLITATAPGFAFSNWFGIVGPKDLPESIALGWNDAINRVLSEPATQEGFNRIGAIVMKSSLAEFKQKIEADREMWRDVIKAAGITAAA